MNSVLKNYQLHKNLQKKCHFLLCSTRFSSSKEAKKSISENLVPFAWMPSVLLPGTPSSCGST